MCDDLFLQHEDIVYQWETHAMPDENLQVSKPRSHQPKPNHRYLVASLNVPKYAIILEQERNLSLFFVATRYKHTTRKTMCPFQATSLLLSFQYKCTLIECLFKEEKRQIAETISCFSLLHLLNVSISGRKTKIPLITATEKRS